MEKVLGSITLSDDQKSQIKAMTGADINNLQIVQLTGESAKKALPGALSVIVLTGTSPDDVVADW